MARFTLALSAFNIQRPVLVSHRPVQDLIVYMYEGCSKSFANGWLP